jgi:transposase
MKKYIGCDLHKKYAVFVVMDERGKAEPPVKVANDLLELRAFLRSLPAGAPVAVEASGSWYWFVDELEQAGLDPRLVNPLEAKKRMGGNKTDPKDAAGMARLLCCGSLPEVWIPPAKLRDFRGLLRTRLALRHHTTDLKNRVHAAIRRYGQYEPGEPKDLFAGKGRVQLSVYVGALPEETRLATRHEWAAVDALEEHIRELEARIRLTVGQLGHVRTLQSLPGVGAILGPTIYLEIGDVSRFGSAEKLASYAGLTPRIYSSAGKTRMGPTPRACNHYLKWAFVEAANVVIMRQDRYQASHAFQLYRRLRRHKDHGPAAVAVARRLAEASWWMLTKNQPYREPAPASIASSTNGSARR